MAEIRMENAVKTIGVFSGAVAGIRAVGTMMQLGRPGCLNKGIVIKFLRLTPPLLPHQEPFILFSHLFNLIAHQCQGIIPRYFSPLSRLSLRICPQQRSFYAVRVVDRHYLGLPLNTQCPPVPLMVWVALKLHYPPIHYPGEHTTILLTYPAGCWQPLLTGNGLGLTTGQKRPPRSTQDIFTESKCSRRCPGYFDELSSSQLWALHRSILLVTSFPRVAPVWTTRLEFKASL